VKSLEILSTQKGVGYSAQWIGLIRLMIVEEAGLPLLLPIVLIG
jgi:hypothetical protein